MTFKLLLLCVIVVGVVIRLTNIILPYACCWLSVALVFINLKRTCVVVVVAE
jgi:hypothetical protein